MSALQSMHIYPIKKPHLSKHGNSTQHTVTNLTDNERKEARQYLDKLYTYGITTLPQIQNKETIAILALEDF